MYHYAFNNRYNHEKNIILTCKSVLYHSQVDEDLFFEWIKKISSIIKVDGKFDELNLYFETSIITDNDLRELIALFYRYKVKNMKQLQIFLNKNNKKWFYDGEPKAYWHKRVFGS